MNKYQLEVIACEYGCSYTFALIAQEVEGLPSYSRVATVHVGFEETDAAPNEVTAMDDIVSSFGDDMWLYVCKPKVTDALLGLHINETMLHITCHRMIEQLYSASCCSAFM